MTMHEGMQRRHNLHDVASLRMQSFKIFVHTLCMVSLLWTPPMLPACMTFAWLVYMALASTSHNIFTWETSALRGIISAEHLASPKPGTYKNWFGTSHFLNSWSENNSNRQGLGQIMGDFGCRTSPLKTKCSALGIIYSFWQRNQWWPAHFKADFLNKL